MCGFLPQPAAVPACSQPSLSPSSPVCFCVNTLSLALPTQGSSQPQNEWRDQINWSCFPKRPEWERGNVSAVSEMEDCVTQWMQKLLQLLQSLWRFCIEFQNFNSSLNFLANKDKAYCGITNNQNFLRFSTVFKPPRDPGCPEQCTQQDRNGKSNTEK